MEDVFQDTISKSNELLKFIIDDLGVNKHQACNALKVVLRTLRDRLPIEEAVHLSAQMPTLIRGAYFEGWKPFDTPVKYDKKEFLEHVRSNLAKGIEAEVEDVVAVVLNAVFMGIDPHEAQKIRKVLPKDVAELIS